MKSIFLLQFNLIAVQSTNFNCITFFELCQKGSCNNHTQTELILSFIIRMYFLLPIIPHRSKIMIIQFIGFLFLSFQWDYAIMIVFHQFTSQSNNKTKSNRDLFDVMKTVTWTNAKKRWKNLIPNMAKTNPNNHFIGRQFSILHIWLDSLSNHGAYLPPSNIGFH